MRREEEETLRRCTERVQVHTLDAPLEKGLAALAGPHAVVVAGGVVVAHGAEVHVGFARGG